MTTEKKKFGFWALLGKLGGKALSLLGKLFKFTKVGLALLSFAGYAAVYNWKFALLLMIAVGFHESGHVWAMKKVGIKTKGFYFLPFVGGAAIAESEFKTYADNVFISIMGAVWGAFLAGLCMAGYYVTGVPMLAAAAAWMSTLNLFNLLPITPLDGGRILNSIAFSVHKNAGVIFLTLSLVGAGLIFWKLHIGLFVLILIIGGVELFFEVLKRVKMAKVRAGKLNKWQLPWSMLDDSQPDGLKKYPETMSAKKLALAILSYVATLAVLIVILKLMKDAPGADLAANFLD